MVAVGKRLESVLLLHSNHVKTSTLLLMRDMFSLSVKGTGIWGSAIEKKSVAVYLDCTLML